MVEEFMAEIKKELEKMKEILVEEFKPFFIILFGSYAKEMQNSESDIDIAIFAKNKTKKDIFTMKQKLERIAMRDVDLVNLADENLSNALKYEVLMTGVVLHCLNSYQFEMYKLDEIREYFDFNESRKVILDRIKKEGTIYGE